jgi:hypothetical protein
MYEDVGFARVAVMSSFPNLKCIKDCLNKRCITQDAARSSRGLENTSQGVSEASPGVAIAI